MIVRPVTPADQTALEELAAASPDGGAVSFRVEEHVPADQVPRGHAVSEHFAAEVDGVLAGAARLDLGTCRFEGEDIQYALLNSLEVHPRYRRRGVAAALTDRRLERARELAGADVVAVAYIQAGNDASLGNAGRWATQISGELVITPIPMRRRPPRPAAGLSVRPPAAAELGEIAATVNARYADHDFYRPWNEARLSGWLAESPLPDPVHHYRVVTDPAGRLLAGCGISDAGRVATLVLERLPLALRAANALLRVVPRDGRMRNLVVADLWFAPGRLDAARYLWETIRWEWRDAGTSLLLPHDPRSPVHQVVAARRWMPTTSETLAISSRRPMLEGTIVDQL